jgi:hypothetical protein
VWWQEPGPLSVFVPVTHSRAFQIPILTRLLSFRFSPEVYLSCDCIRSPVLGLGFQHPNSRDDTGSASLAISVAIRNHISPFSLGFETRRRRWTSILPFLRLIKTTGNPAPEHTGFLLSGVPIIGLSYPPRAETTPAVSTRFQAT